MAMYWHCIGYVFSVTIIVVAFIRNTVDNDVYTCVCVECEYGRDYQNVYIHRFGLDHNVNIMQLSQ